MIEKRGFGGFIILTETENLFWIRANESVWMEHYCNVCPIAFEPEPHRAHPLQTQTPMNEKEAFVTDTWINQWAESICLSDKRFIQSSVNVGVFGRVKE